MVFCVLLDLLLDFSVPIGHQISARTINCATVFFSCRGFRRAAGASQDVQRAPNVCCEDIFNDESAQRPPQFHERPRKLKKKVGRGKKKKREILDGSVQGCPGGRGVGCRGVRV